MGGCEGKAMNANMTKRNENPTMWRRGLVAVAVAVTLLGRDSGTVAAHDRDLEKLFSKVTTAVGEKYTAIRTQIYEQPGAEEFLVRKQTSADTASERWLAEILLSRLKEREEFLKLEQEFHDRVFWLYCCYPDRSHVPRLMPRLWEGLLLPDEKSPYEPKPNRTEPDIIEQSWGESAPRVREYWESLRIRKSELWTPFCGEILLKGWVPAGTVQDPPRPPLPGGTRGPVIPELYLRQAILMLGKLKEKRAGPVLLPLLKDRKLDPFCLSVAAVALGRMQDKDSLPALLEICESPEERGWLLNAAVEAVALMEDHRAIPRLQRIMDEKLAHTKVKRERIARGEKVEALQGNLTYRATKAREVIKLLSELKQGRKRCQERS